MSDNAADVDVEALKAQHLNQALTLVEEALGQGRQTECKVCGKHENTHVGQAKACFGGMGTVFIPNTQSRQDAIEARAQARFDALLEAHRQWAATEGPTFTLAILNARTAREQQEAVYNAMQGAFLAGAMAMQEGGK